MRQLDLNCDMGEGTDPEAHARDGALMAHISSANIACGYHAGDAPTMVTTVRQALRHGVAIGAHPGLDDKAHFGRRECPITADEARALVLAQIGALQAIVQAEGGRLHHVKPHGALYNMAAQQPALADAIAGAVARFNPELVLVGLAGSALVQAGERAGLKVANEVFADRSYQADGTLIPRQQAGALIDDASQSMAQVMLMVQQGQVHPLAGPPVAIRADTLCVHGDGPQALAFVRQIRARLEAEGIRITPTAR